MKTTTSTNAHHPGSAKRASQEAQIKLLIRNEPQTLKTLALQTGLPKSTIAARLTDLQKMGIVTGFETMEEVNSAGRLTTVTVYKCENDWLKMLENSRNFRRNLAIARIESSLKNDLEFLPQYLVAGMRAFLQLEKELGQLDSDYKQPEGARPPDKFTGV